MNVLCGDHPAVPGRFKSFLCLLPAAQLLGIAMQKLSNCLIHYPVFTSMVPLRSGFQRLLKVSLQTDTGYCHGYSPE